MNHFHHIFSLYLISIASFSICMDTSQDLFKIDLVKTETAKKEKKANHLTDNDIQEIFDEVKRAKESNDSQQIEDCIKLLEALFEQNIDKKGTSFIQEQIKELEKALANLLKKHGPLTQSMMLQDEIFKQLNENVKTKEEAERLAKREKEEKEKTRNLMQKLLSLEKERHDAVSSDEEKIRELEQKLKEAKEELEAKHKKLSETQENLKKAEKESGMDISLLNEENTKDTDSKTESKESNCILF